MKWLPLMGGSVPAGCKAGGGLIMALGMVNKKAADRAAILEGLTDEQKQRYRQRRSAFLFKFQMFDYLLEVGVQDREALLKALHSYVKDGVVPAFENDTTAALFKNWFKSEIDKDFNEYCYQCYCAENAGRKGAGARWVLEKVLKKLPEKVLDVPMVKLVKGDTQAWRDLKSMSSDNVVNETKAKIEKVRQEVLQESGNSEL